MSDKIKKDDLKEVSGGSAGTKNLGGRCGQFVCEICGKTPHVVMDEFLVCYKIMVAHNEGCKYAGTVDETCSHCIHNERAGMSCAAPNK